MVLHEAQPMLRLAPNFSLAYCGPGAPTAYPWRRQRCRIRGWSVSDPAWRTSVSFPTARDQAAGHMAEADRSAVSAITPTAHGLLQGVVGSRSGSPRLRTAVRGKLRAKGCSCLSSWGRERFLLTGDQDERPNFSS
jgi:hypothetical protein